MPDYFKGTFIKFIFNSRLPHQNFISVGTCMIMLLQHNLLPEPEQRLAAITLLYELYRGESLANTPFANVFIHLLVCDILSFCIK